jgi:serine/threonine-protein kinase 24/25/MST4
MSPPNAAKSRDYTCLDALGQGTYGTCYKVVPNGGGERCVMKVIPLAGLSQKDIDGAFSEATLLSRIHHPHIVGYLDAWVENSHLYIVMEFCSGGDLSARLKARRMSEAELWQCTRDISCGLEHLHSKRIMHRRAALCSCFASCTFVAGSAMHTASQAMYL